MELSQEFEPQLRGLLNRLARQIDAPEPSVSPEIATAYSLTVSSIVDLVQSELSPVVADFGLLQADYVRAQDEIARLNGFLATRDPVTAETQDTKLGTAFKQGTSRGISDTLTIVVEKLESKENQRRPLKDIANDMRKLKEQLVEDAAKPTPPPTPVPPPKKHSAGHRETM